MPATTGRSKSKHILFYVSMLIIPIILAGVISLSFAYVTNTVVIYSSGQIVSEIVAVSGSAKDIQAAIDLAVALGIGTVRIPEGTFNFVEIGEPWKTVVVPAGISIFGAPTERDANDQVVEWKTVLVMPYDVPSGAVWFKIVGNSDPNKPSRFSDIKLIGYRDFDPNSTTMHIALEISNVINFRVDHCYFKHTTGGIWIYGHYSSGVIDHCYLVNDFGVPTPYAERTVDYGVQVNRAYPELETEWPPITEIMGKYTNYTVFIEDSYFQKWRHCVVANRGAHVVFRYNVINNTWAFGQVDMHESWQEGLVGGRAYEIYGNKFINPIPYSTNDAIRLRSGAAMIFNNSAPSGYNYFIYTYNAGWNETFYPRDIYIWNNTYSGTLIWGSPPPTEEVEYFLYKPDWYTPYPYPHPLTLP